MALNDGLPASSKATISPSRTMLGPGCANSAASFGKSAASSSPRRERRLTPFSSTNASTR